MLECWTAAAQPSLLSAVSMRTACAQLLDVIKWASWMQIPSACWMQIPSACCMALKRSWIQCIQLHWELHNRDASVYASKQAIILSLAENARLLRRPCCTGCRLATRFWVWLQAGFLLNLSRTSPKSTCRTSNSTPMACVCWALLSSAIHCAVTLPLLSKNSRTGMHACNCMCACMCENGGTDLGDVNSSVATELLHPLNRTYCLHAGVGYTPSWSQAITI